MDDQLVWQIDLITMYTVLVIADIWLYCRLKYVSLLTSTKEDNAYSTCQYSMNNPSFWPSNLSIEYKTPQSGSILCCKGQSRCETSYELDCQARSCQPSCHSSYVYCGRLTAEAELALAMESAPAQVGTGTKGPWQKSGRSVTRSGCQWHWHCHWH